MPYVEQYERMLARSWRAAMDASETAELHGRAAHARRLRRAARMIEECQLDVVATKLILARGGKAALKHSTPRASEHVND